MSGEFSLGFSKCIHLCSLTKGRYKTQSSISKSSPLPFVVNLSKITGPRQPWICFLSLLISFPNLGFEINGIIESIFFCAWQLLLIMMIFRINTLLMHPFCCLYIAGLQSLLFSPVPPCLFTSWWLFEFFQVWGYYK